MSQRDRLIEQLCARPRPPDARFDDVRRVLEAFGWEMKRQRGSHVTFKKPGERAIVVPLVSGRTVKQAYLDNLCKLLGLDD